MTAMSLNTVGAPSGEDLTPAKHHADRWALHRAGIVNVWFYYDTTFEISGGRLILRGTNGSGKSRALELLFPFLFDADRRRMDATGSGKVQLSDLMKSGAQEMGNRVGYLWAELRRPLGLDDSLGETQRDGMLSSGPDGDGYAYLTIGAHLRWSRSTGEVKPHYFTTPLRVGEGGLSLMSATRDPLSRDELTERVGHERVSTSPEEHRVRVAQTVFGLTGERAAERYSGLLQLLHTLRSPDVGNRIDEGRLPQILTDALPPLSERALDAAGEKLDGLTETRDAQQRLKVSLEHVEAFFGIYRRYAAAKVAEAAIAARDAAGTHLETIREAQERRRHHKALETEKVQVEADLRELESTIDELDSTISGIKESAGFKGHQELHERGQRVHAQKNTAEARFAASGSARGNERNAVEQADRRADDVVDAGAVLNAALGAARRTMTDAGVPDGIVAGLPNDLVVTAADSRAHTVAIRTTVDGDPQPHLRPVPRSLGTTPDDTSGFGARIDDVRQAVTLRAEHAHRRGEAAHVLEREHQHVIRAAEKAADRESDAEVTGVEAEERSDELSHVVDEYVVGWRAWLSAPMVAPLAPAGQRDGADALARVDDALADPAALLDAPVDLLRTLDSAAQEITEPPRKRYLKEISLLDIADDEDGRTDSKLAAEQRRLEAAMDPEPDPAPGQIAQPQGAVPFWRAVDFAPGLDNDARAGVEGALTGSGLLTASISPDGTLHAGDGQLLATAWGTPVTTRSATDVLRPDPSGGIATDLVDEILSRIGLHHHSTGPGSKQDSGVALWIAKDGGWGAGPLTGKHRPQAAQYVGATARAAHRAARLAEITTERQQIAQAITHRAASRQQIEEKIETLTILVGKAPRSQPIVTSHSIAAEASRRAQRAGEAAQKARQEADEMDRSWKKNQQLHRQICGERGLPTDARELETVAGRSERAAAECVHAGDALRRLDRRRDAHRDALVNLASAIQAREEAESEAGRAWSVWSKEAAELAALQENVGADAQEAADNLQQTSQALETARGEAAMARPRHEQLISDVSAANGEAKRAEEAITGTTENLSSAAARLQRTCGLTGITAAAFRSDPGDLTAAGAEPRAVKAVATRILSAVHDHTTRSDETTLGKAQQHLERELSGIYDIDARVDEGIRIIALVDATGIRPIAAAATELTKHVADGEAALTEKERKVFEEFVLGGVAGELRDRLNRASELVEAMNASLRTIRTSHGIGVKLRWKLDDDADPAVTRLRDLVSRSSELRRREEDQELTVLLRDRVDRSFALDPSSGYAAHLRSALDYRIWHRMEVIILGPEPGQERRISTRAKLSQGETRFVSYVTLFAAIDAYLSGLPDTARSLRMLLLDDAFAKVDDPTIAELMGLLVRLDIDFVMTGHSLWGTYPQVPALDAYEVRRGEGTAAITTRVHWDGHNRHLRPMG
ncbi:TIGR02680 family protein [Promicromonospora xylanilytica]